MEVGKQGGRNRKVLAGAMAEVDNLLNDHGLDPTDLVSQIHNVIVGRRLSVPSALRQKCLSHCLNAMWDYKGQLIQESTLRGSCTNLRLLESIMAYPSGSLEFPKTIWRARQDSNPRSPA